MVYSIASSSNLTIRFTFAVNAVKYICRCIANKPLEDVYGIEVDKEVDKNDNSESTSCQSNVNLDNHENKVEDMLLKQIEILQEEIKIKNEQMVDKNDNSESTSCQSNVNLDNHENKVEDMLLKQIEILQEEIKIKNEQIEQLHKLLDQEQQLRMVSEQKKLEIEDSKEEKEEQKETKKKWWKFW